MYMNLPLIPALTPVATITHDKFNQDKKIEFVQWKQNMQEAFARKGLQSDVEHLLLFQCRMVATSKDSPSLHLLPHSSAKL